MLIMDNARIHHSQELKDLCRDADVDLACLALNLLDYNPFETSFATLKAWIKRNIWKARRYEQGEGGFGTFLEDPISTVQQEHSTKKNGEEGDWGNLFRLAGVQ